MTDADRPYMSDPLDRREAAFALLRAIKVKRSAHAKANMESVIHDVVAGMIADALYEANLAIVRTKRPAEAPNYNGGRHLTPIPLGAHAHKKSGWFEVQTILRVFEIRWRFSNDPVPPAT